MPLRVCLIDVMNNDEGILPRIAVGLLVIEQTICAHNNVLSLDTHTQLITLCGKYH